MPNEIRLDFSNLPSEVAPLLSQQQHTKDLTDDLSRVLSLEPDDRDLIHQEIVGAIARTVDTYLRVAQPKN
ncbi:MAG: hypothetical protein M3540_12850 [Actinomycetota bacterium]|nr:hypothetical protein [Actinomycetota bacterium]